MSLEVQMHVIFWYGGGTSAVGIKSLKNVNSWDLVGPRLEIYSVEIALRGPKFSFKDVLSQPFKNKDKERMGTVCNSGLFKLSYTTIMQHCVTVEVNAVECSMP